MKTYTFWNNKGGTGKTSLCFQTVLQYAKQHPEQQILVIDLCPQANLSELMLGGMLGNGASNLISLWTNNQQPRRTIGGYFHDHLPSAHMMFNGFNANNYICHPHAYNRNVPNNISLVAGDSYVELLANSIAAQASIILPVGDAYLLVLRWVIDFLDSLRGNDTYQMVFIDTNPSFAIYTQMAIAAADELIIPVTADSSSVRALHNVLALVYGINPNANNLNYSFYTKVVNSPNIQLPRINSIVRNRLTQYMRRPASAYRAVLDSLSTLSNSLRQQYGNYFCPNFNIIDIRDFNTVGQIAYAEAKRFADINAGRHIIGGRPIQANQQYISDCHNTILQLVGNL